MSLVEEMRRFNGDGPTPPVSLAREGSGDATMDGLLWSDDEDERAAKPPAARHWSLGWFLLHYLAAAADVAVVLALAAAGRVAYVAAALGRTPTATTWAACAAAAGLAVVILAYLGSCTPGLGAAGFVLDTSRCTRVGGSAAAVARMLLQALVVVLCGHRMLEWAHVPLSSHEPLHLSCTDSCSTIMTLGGLAAAVWVITGSVPCSAGVRASAATTVALAAWFALVNVAGDELPWLLTAQGAALVLLLLPGRGLPDRLLGATVVAAPEGRASLCSAAIRCGRRVGRVPSRCSRSEGQQLDRCLGRMGGTHRRDGGGGSLSRGRSATRRRRGRRGASNAPTKPDTSRSGSESGASRSPSPSPRVLSKPASPSAYRGGKLTIFPRAALKFGSVIGEGGFGQVLHATLVSTGEEVAVKRISRNGDSEQRARAISALMSEASHLCRITHDRIVRVLGIVSDGEELLLITEYAPDGSLDRLLDNYGSNFATFPQSELLQICLDVAEGLAFLHSFQPEPCLHLDLKPDNVLLFNGRAKLTDFGLARHRRRRRRRMTTTGAAAGGTPHYAPGSQLSGKRATTSMDVYSLGMTIFEIFTSYDAMQELAKRLEQRRGAPKLDEFPPHVPPFIREIVLGCCTGRLELRLTAEQVVELLRARVA